MKGGVKKWVVKTRNEWWYFLWLKYFHCFLKYWLSLIIIINHFRKTVKDIILLSFHIHSLDHSLIYYKKDKKYGILYYILRITTTSFYAFNYTLCSIFLITYHWIWKQYILFPTLWCFFFKTTTWRVYILLTTTIYHI